MVWIRRLDAPVEQVWQTVSTREGLAKWWIVAPTAFELRPGGAFHHHWSSTIASFEEHRYIDFVDNTGDYASTGGMHFELSRLDGNATVFAFLDTWGPDARTGGARGGEAEQAGGPGTPWAGVAAGWHAMVDRLESAINGRGPRHTKEELAGFYLGYLRDMYR